MTDIQLPNGYVIDERTRFKVRYELYDGMNHVAMGRIKQDLLKRIQRLEDELKDKKLSPFIRHENETLVKQLTLIAENLDMNTSVMERGPFTNLVDCQRAYLKVRDDLGVGASQISQGEVFDQYGQCVAHISYNGRLWEPLRWSPDMKPIAEAPKDEDSNPGFKA